MTKIFEPFETQKKAAKIWKEKKRMLNFSECGTGKTIACIYTVKTYWKDARVLVLAPLTILEAAWGKDLDLAWSEVTKSFAYAKNRVTKFEEKKQWVLTNHDAAKAIVQNNWHKDFDILIVDEADIFRNRTSQRSRAALLIAQNVDKVVLMTGTPTPNTVLDIWHLAFMVDGGERLGKNFYGFRQQVCTPTAIPGVLNAMRWEDKSMANDLVTTMLSDITHRVLLADVEELPSIIIRTITIELPKKIKVAYEFLKQESMLQLQNGEMLNAVHAGARMQKMLQLLSGAVYNEGKAYDLHTQRHKLVLDLVQETNHALVAFNWRHQKEGLVKEATKRDIRFAVIDGSTPAKDRPKIVEDFQKGMYQVLFAHPQSAGHGLTLTKANRVIWASPTYRADLFEQFNHRIYRTGQKRKTEIILVAANKTAEVEVYRKLEDKADKMCDLLSTLVQLERAF